MHSGFSVYGNTKHEGTHISVPITMILCAVTQMQRQTAGTNCPWPLLPVPILIGSTKHDKGTAICRVCSPHQANIPEMHSGHPATPVQAYGGSTRDRHIQGSCEVCNTLALTALVAMLQGQW